MNVTGAEAANDRLTVNGLVGNDDIDASAVGSGALALTLSGGSDNDELTGGAAVARPPARAGDPAWQPRP